MHLPGGYMNGHDHWQISGERVVELCYVLSAGDGREEEAEKDDAYGDG